MILTILQVAVLERIMFISEKNAFPSQMRWNAFFLRDRLIVSIIAKSGKLS